MPTLRPEEHVLQPGDLKDVVIQLRSLMQGLNSCAYLTEVSFEALGGSVEEARAEASPKLQGAGNAVFALLERLEKTPEYKRLRKG